MENINTYINLTLVLTKIQGVAYQKAIVFVTAMISIYSLMFLYICLFTLFLGKPIEQVGSRYFITHSFYTFSVLVAYLVVILIYGAQANDIDHKIKDDLIKIQVDCNEAIIMSFKDRVWEKDGCIHIMTKTEDGKFYSLRDEITYDNLDEFTCKKEEVEENTGILSEQI